MPSTQYSALFTACVVLVGATAGVAAVGGATVPDAEPHRSAGPSQADAEHTLEIVPENGTTSYHVGVTGGIEPANVNGRGTNSDDSVGENGSTADGQVAGGFQGDSYRYTGRLIDLRLDGGNATVLVDGEPVDPTTYPDRRAIEFLSCTQVRIHGNWSSGEIDAHGYTENGEMDTEILSPDLSSGPTTVDLADAEYVPEDGWVIDAVALWNEPGDGLVNYRLHPDRQACDRQIAPGSGGDNGSSGGTIEVVPADGGATYRVQVDGELRPGNVNGRELNSDDAISEDGERATGAVAGGFQGDSYRFDGEVEKLFLLEGNATFRVNGERVQPDGPPVEYLSCTRVRVAGDWEATGDDIWAHGYTDDGEMDTEIFDVNLSDGPTVFDIADTNLPAENWTVDNVALSESHTDYVHSVDNPNASACEEQIAPDSEQEHTLEIIPDEGDSTYHVEVSGQLRPGNVNGRELNSDDSIGDDGSSADGQVAGGFQGDSYRFTGEIEELTVDGDATVRVDGERVEPGSSDSEGS